jgi:hypothetical protein
MTIAPKGAYMVAAKLWSKRAEHRSDELGDQFQLYLALPRLLIRNRAFGTTSLETMMQS